VADILFPVLAAIAGFAGTMYAVGRIRTEAKPNPTFRMTPGGLNRLLSVDVYSMLDIDSVHKRLMKLKAYKYELDEGTLPSDFYYGVASASASGRILKNMWWANNLDFAIEQTEKILKHRRSEKEQGLTPGSLDKRPWQ
jgi:hypothetical protein